MEKRLELLTYLGERFSKTPYNDCSSLDAAKDLNWDHALVVGNLKSIEALNKVTITKETLGPIYKLTDEGEQILENGSPEYRLLADFLEKEGVIRAEDTKSESWMTVGMSVLVKQGIVKIRGGVVEICKKMDIDSTQDLLRRIVNGEELESAAVLKELSRRKLIHSHTITYFTIKATESFTTEIEEQITDLTQTMLTTGKWKDASFKTYNFNAAGILPRYGSTHPLIETMNVFRNVLVQMGFEEMPTRRWVESSFWNFDALFQPQTHPVRDAHDTFFMKDPVAHEVPDESTVWPDFQYFSRVRDIHERGDELSLGYQSKWSPAEACKLVMRTHTTAISSQMLRKIAQEYQETGGVFRKRQLFSIDRVFRNETLDATHLVEFHQVEGVIASEDANLASLMGFIASFFKKIGIPEVKFKATYNPYTEPSMEVFGYHPLMKKWTEIGNSGVFRPEMLQPMGLPPNVKVLGLGLSLERPTMINRGIKDIRELFGPRARLTVF